MSRVFLNGDKPLLTVMLQTRQASHAIDTIHKCIPLGAEAFGLQIEQLSDEFKNEETYKEIFAHMDGKPVYVTNYRFGTNSGRSDEKLAEGLITLAKCGATLCDVMGDMYDEHPEQLTMDEEAIKKQMQLIAEIHNNGSQVLMSSHIMKYTSAERILEMALSQQERGADIVKIVVGADDMDQQLENLKIVQLLKQNLRVPFLFLSSGECTLLRRIGPIIGCCMYLCVYEHDELATPQQPLLTNAKAIRDNFYL